MAGIEKICECCSRHLGQEMYRIKRNNIQVCRDCRPKFKGLPSTLLLFKPSVLDREITLKFHKGRFVDMPVYEYALIAPGLVIPENSWMSANGFFNQTTDPRGFGKVVRRLRHLVGRENLKIKTINTTLAEYIDGLPK